MSAPIAVTIDGTPFTPIIEDSIRIDSILGSTIDTARLKIYDKAANLTVPEGKDIIITRTDTGARIFGGLTSMVTDWAEGISRWFEVNCQDYTVLLDRTVVFNSYAPGFTYAGLVGDRAILAHLFAAAVVGQNGQTGAASEIDGATLTTQGLTGMAALEFKYRYLREAVELIANYVGYNYYVDYDEKLHYYFRSTQIAPFNLDSQPNGTTTIGYRGLRRQKDASRIVNNYTLLGANLHSDAQTYILPSNGVATVLTLTYSDIGINFPLLAPPGYAHVRVYKNTGTDVTPVWTEKVVGTLNVDNMPPNDVLHDTLGKTLTFATAPPNLTNSVKIIAVYPYGGGYVSAHQGSITTYGRVLSYRLAAADANSVVALQQKAQNLKDQFAYALETLTLTVDDTSFPAGNTNRFVTGQWVNLRNHILGIDKSYLIHRMTTSILGGQLLNYELELRSWVSA